MPHYSLEEVRKLAEQTLENPKRGKVVFTAKPKSIDKVIEAYRSRGQSFSSDKAQKYIYYRLFELKAEDFHKSEHGDWGFVTDQYGVRHNGIPWYIKFRLDKENGELDQISFHPLERDMTLANGKILKKEWSAS